MASFITHPTNHVWHLFWHMPGNSGAWNDHTLCQIPFPIQSLDTLLTIQHELRPEWLQTGMYFFMRDGIQPAWEDPANHGKGGYSCLIATDKAAAFFKKLMMVTVGEYTSFASCLNGISISPKKQFCVVKLWINESVPVDITPLYEELPELQTMQLEYRLWPTTS